MGISRNKGKSKKSKMQNIRVLIQIVVLVMVVVAALNRYLVSIDEAIPWISESKFHYICPTCGVVSIYQFIMASTPWVIKITSILGIAVCMVIMLTIVFGPIVCGFICPFGTIQDGIATVGRKIFKGKYNGFIPQKVDDKLKCLRYFVLAGTVVLTVMSGALIIEVISPYHAFLGIFNGTIYAVGLIVLCIIIFLSLFIQRPWCKYLCPYGALLGIFNRFKVFRIFRNNKTCIRCNRCNHACPMNISIVKTEEIRDLRCISCLKCVEKRVCPKTLTLLYTSKDEIENEEE